MNGILKYAASLAFILVFFSASGQETGFEDSTSYIILRKEMSGGVNLHTSGWGFEFRTGKNVTAFKRRMLEFSLVTMKSPKEIRSINPYFNNSKSYIYGKLNNIYVLRGGIGMYRQLNRKPRRAGGVELRYYYAAGASLSFAKPVYLNIITFTSSFYEYIITTERYDPEKHFVENIYGRASLFKGIEKTRVYPGGYGKFGVLFDYSKDYYKVRTIEAGAVVDLYPVPVPIMAFNNSYYGFLTFFVSFHFGSRYNRKPKKEDGEM